MPYAPTDLLSATRALLRAATWFDMFLVALLSVIAVALFIGDPERMTILGSSTLPPGQRLFAARVMVCVGLASCVLLLPLLGLLRRIVDSARSGDPFVPENGSRLRRIGWLMLAINMAGKAGLTLALRGHVGFPVSLTAVLTVLMVFVIARIFDTGSSMRAELQETV